ncbi:M23 family metallopeptidase [Dyella sp. M7H15-1]|uniref:M23 family metallopeptidase n=1 Tax=Dyella sp. M7H15-1 TaxID=2501295 RepID=UPI0013E89CA2|nr:M23 family metallopeptidase [Dyella sp. M7H15-1]
MMFVASLPCVKKHLARVHLLAVASGMLAVWLAAYAVIVSAEGMRADSGMIAFADGQQPDFLQMLEKSWLSHTNVSKRVYAATADNVLDEPSTAPGSYFRTLTRIYGAATDHFAFGYESDAQDTDEPLPMDEVARFHQMETRMPIARMRVTSEFGHRPNPIGKGHVFHRGIDLAAPAGTPVYAVAPGTIIRATSDRSFGNVVVINHHNGYKTLYAHNSRLLVKVGEKVKAGQQIAKIGSTGHSTGPHLHFEIHRSGQRVDPGPYLAAL